MSRRAARGGGAGVRYSFLKILTGSDLSRRRLPFMEARSDQEQPVVWLTACGHGDEVGGIVVIQEVFRRFRRRPLRKGSVLAFPLMNPIGFDSGSRHVTLSEEDLNRSFPGNPNGSLAERIADKIFSSIVATRPAVVLDLHNDWTMSIPYTLLDPPPTAECTDACNRAAALADQIGLPVVLETDAMRRSLSYNLIEHGIPALTVELGESYVVNERNVELGVWSIWNVLSCLDMVEPATEPSEHEFPDAVRGRVLTYASRPVSSTSGIIRFLCRPGAVVKAGQPVARIYNAFGKLQETIKVPRESIVLGYTDSSVAFPGAPIVSLGVI